MRHIKKYDVSGCGKYFLMMFVAATLVTSCGGHKQGGTKSLIQWRDRNVEQTADSLARNNGTTPYSTTND